MMNRIWGFFLSFGVLCAMFTGKSDVILNSAILGAENAVNLSFNLMGVMCLWMGMIKIAEKAGIIQWVTRCLKPGIQLIFPNVPVQHPAMNAIVMVISANLFGLGNAATPLGIKAMQELQTLNNDKKTATAAMCTLLAICTSGFTLVPTTAIALRRAAGAEYPAEIIGNVLIIGFLSMVSVLIFDFICRISLYRGNQK